ncbi:MOSC domain-containing protein [Vibrio sp. TRT 21S02]|uniref:MOSC domain-containing protein n=1 Tax=Vibrio sp. TRT 21S02 TaxID=3418507 RepID=UPI003CE7A732
MVNHQTTLLGVFVGQVKQQFGMETAIAKRPVEQALYLSMTGLEGDQCADHKHHGGPERALHQYPVEHYAYWQQKYRSEYIWQAPGMGENISTEGMTEETVYLGDRYQWGEAVIEVSQPRSPCYKLSKRWGVEQFSVDMQDISRCGWLFRVIQPGLVSVNNPLILVERVENAMTIREVCDCFFTTPLERSGLLKLQQQERLSNSWMEKVKRRLETGDVENWNFRLLGHA